MPTKRLSKEEKGLQRIKGVVHNLQLMEDITTFNGLCSAPPKPEWIKRHPFVKTKNEKGQMEQMPYVPIETVEMLLRSIFPAHRVEVISYCALFQSISVHVRVHYIHPVTGEWNYHDGLGAVAIQTDAGASAADLGKIKTDAVMKALPAAESYAIKDACEKFGNIFGANLTRLNYPEINMIFAEGEEIKAPEVGAVPEDIIKEIHLCETAMELKDLYGAHPELHANSNFTDMMKKRKLELHGSTAK